jgi:tetratricopeptide (TPR) repeat protein
MMTMNTQAAMSAVERATRAIKENRWRDAIADLRAAHDRAPGDVDIAGKLGFALSRDERYEEAIRVFDELHKKQPRDPKWPYMIGYQFYHHKHWARAIHWFDRALALRLKYVKVLYRKGYAHTALGQEQESITAFSDCIACWEEMTGASQEHERPSYGKTQFQLGKIYLKKGLTFKARRHLQIAAEIDSQNHDVLYELGQCYLKLNQLDEALRALQAADQIKPATDYILDRLARAHAEKGDYAARREGVSADTRAPPTLICTATPGNDVFGAAAISQSAFSPAACCQKAARQSQHSLCSRSGARRHRTTQGGTCVVRPGRSLSKNKIQPRL